MKNDENKGKDANGIELQVVESLQEDIGKGIARLSSDVMDGLGISSGDLVEVKGKNKTVVKAMRDFSSAKKEENYIRINGTIRQNVGSSIGDKVIVKPVKVENAKSITLSPTQEGIRFSNDPTEYFHNKLLQKPLGLGEKIVIDVFGTRLVYVVSKVSPKGNVIVTPETKIIVSDEIYSGDLWCYGN